MRLEEDLDAAVRNASGAGAGGGDDGKPAEEGKLGYSGLMYNM